MALTKIKGFLAVRKLSFWQTENNIISTYSKKHNQKVHATNKLWVILIIQQKENHLFTNCFERVHIIAVPLNKQYIPINKK